MNRALFLLLLAATAAGCGSGNDPNASSGATTGAGAMPAAGPDDLSITLTPFTIPVGEERIDCQYIPPDGKERWIKSFAIDMAPGSHHLVVFRITDPAHTAAYGPTPCTQLEVPNGFDGMLPGSQEQHSAYSLPDGVGFRLGADHGLYFQSHYINSTSQPITSAVTYKAGTVDASTVKEPAGMIFYANFNLDIPPGESKAAETCLAPADAHLLLATGHMHKHGTAFDATVGEASVYHTSQWNEPAAAIFPDPGFLVKKNDPIAWTCSYFNDTGAPLLFGNSASKNEMCILGGLFYPSPGSGTDFGGNCK